MRILQRTNYTEPTVSLAGLAFDEDNGSNTTARSRARETISDKRKVDGLVRKKTQTKNVRDALVYRKNLATLIEESVRSLSCYYYYVAPILNKIMSLIL